MGKINWTRVLLGGFVAGLVFNILQFAAWAWFLRRELSAPLEALGHPLRETAGATILIILVSFLAGFLVIWLYAAIRPRCGAGPKTAAVAGIFAGILLVIPNLGWGSLLRLIPARVWVIDAVDTLVIAVVGTLVGAWLYKEEGP